MLRGGGGGGITEGTTPIAGGTDKQVQFNDGGLINGNAGLQFNKATGNLLFGTTGAIGTTAPTTQGLFFNSNGQTILYSNNGNFFLEDQLSGGGLTIDCAGNGGARAIVSVPATGSLQFGDFDVDTNASIVAQTLRSQGALTGGTTNQAGKNWTFIASPGKGTGAGGNFIFQTAPAGGSGSTPNTPVTALTLGAATAYVQPGAGTTAFAPLQYTSGTNLTTAQAGAREFDGAQHYATIDTTSGRAAIASEQYFHLTGNGGTISTIANFFGTTSNISLVASAHYIIDIEAWFSVQTGTQTATWTLTNSAAPTSQNIDFVMSPVTGIVAPAGSASATMLAGQIQGDATATKALTATAGLTSGATIFTKMRIWLINGTGTSLKIQLTSSSANTFTPLTGSWWRCRRVAAGNVGTFAS
jgi:hypothetical protein